MVRSERDLKELGATMAELIDAVPEAELDLDRGRARLLAARVEPLHPPPRRLGARLGMLAAAALVAVLVLLLFRTRSKTPLAFEVDAKPGVAGAWIAAPRTEATPLRFSDGSLLRLASGGRARVAALEAEGAEIALERGTLDLAIVHREETRWRVNVGPFVVTVVGTRFETSWDPERERFSVTLKEGAVRVSGPVVGEDRLIRAGERITVVASSMSVERADAAEPKAPPEPEAARAPLAAPDPSEAAVPPAPSSSSAAAPSKPQWRTLATAAKYQEALAAAEASGFEALLASSSAADLRVLADTARLAGDGRRAEQAASALLERFPRSSEAGDVAFMLGRAAQDQRHDRATARRWFERYLGEHPGGRFAEEAAGRLVELADQQGDAAGAKTAAERYLARHPSGAHAVYAERVLDRAPR